MIGTKPYQGSKSKPQAYTPEEAQASIANLIANPVPGQAGKWQFSYNMLGSWRADYIPGIAGYHYGDVRIQDQEAKPTNPGIRGVMASTYGKTIPISLGKRRVAGNLIQSTRMVPKLEGSFEYEISYDIPIYQDDPPVDGEGTPGGGGFVIVPCKNPPGATTDFCGDDERPDPDNPPDPGGCGDDPCNPKDPPTPPDEGSAPSGDYCVITATCPGDTDPVCPEPEVCSLTFSQAQTVYNDEVAMAPDEMGVYMCRNGVIIQRHDPVDQDAC